MKSITNIPADEQGNKGKDTKSLGHNYFTHKFQRQEAGKFLDWVQTIEKKICRNKYRP